MRAVWFERFGAPEVLRFGMLPDPEPGAGEIVVNVHAASVNAADWQSRRGHFGPVSEFPHVPGRDFAGTVAAVGSNVDTFVRGDAVFGVCAPGHEGAYAEKLAIDAGIVALKPDTVSFVEAAAVALTGLTALVSIEQTLELRSGEAILIRGGAGGVGSMAVQLAKLAGAHVIATASRGNLDYLRELGADEVIDYRTQDLSQFAGRCDAALDAVGGDGTMETFSALRAGGRAAFIASVEAPAAPRSDLASVRPAVMRDRKHLERIAALLTSRAIHCPRISLYPLADAASAHVLSESKHLTGKLVLTVR